MKIAHLVPYFIPESVGGTEIYVLRLCKALRQMGDDVCIIVPGKYALKTQQQVIEDIAVYRFSVSARDFRHGLRDGGALDGWGLIMEFLRDWKPDLLHSHAIGTIFQTREIEEVKGLGLSVVATLHLPTLGYGCAKGTLIRSIGTPCDGISESVTCASCALGRHGLSERFSKRLASLPLTASRILDLFPGKFGTAAGMRHRINRMQSLQREWIKSIDAIIAVADWAKRVLCENGTPAGKVHVIRTGIEPPETGESGPALEPVQPPIRIGYMGRLDETKGVHVIIGAMHSLPEHTGLSLEIYGDGDPSYRERLLAMIGKDERIKLKGFVEPELVYGVTAKFDLLCVPSTGVEMYPLVAVEGLAVGTPIIASDIGGLAEIVIDGVNGKLFPPGDHIALAKILEEIVRQPGIVDRWRGGIGVPITVSEMANKHRQLYTNLLGTRV